LRNNLFDVWLNEYLTPTGENREGPTDVISPNEYLGELRKGRWPGSDSGWTTADSGRNPRSLIRVAQLCENHTAEQKGGTWHVISCDYPLPSFNMFHHVPVNEDDYVNTVLLCVDGPDRGCVAQTRYYRWKDGSFEIDGIDDSAKVIAENQAMYQKLKEECPLLASHDFLLAYGHVSIDGFLTADHWDKACVYVFENDGDAMAGYPLRRSGDVASRDGITWLASGVQVAAGVQETEILVLPKSDAVTVCGGGSVERLGLAEAQERMNTGCYSVDGASSMAVAYHWAERGSTRSCLADCFTSESDAERAMGEGLLLGAPVEATLPPDIGGATPFSWEVLSWSDSPKYERNTKVMLVRYGAPEDVRGVVALGWQGVTKGCWDMLSLPTNAFFSGNRHFGLDAEHGIDFYDVPAGATIQWYSVPDDDVYDDEDAREYMAYVPGAGIGDREMLLDVAKSTSLS